LSSNNAFQRNHANLLKNISKTSMSPASNILEFLKSNLEAIGENLGSSLCIIIEANKSYGFQFLCGYNIESSSHAEYLIKLIKKQAEDSLQYQKITYVQIESFILVYLVPLVNDKYLGILALGFERELDDHELEILESISEMLSSSISRFHLQKQIDQQYFSTVKSLVIALEAKDLYTQGHSQRVADYSKIIGKYLRFTDEEIKELEVTGLVHDVGKIGINDQLLTKSDKLTESEFDSIKQHPEIGSKILMPLNVSENIMLGTLLHHKRYDLTGYPVNYYIDKLPLVPSIIGVADAFDAMTSERSYKETISKQSAIDELKRFRGTQFQPDIVDIIEELVHNNKL
jgi:response regulator RpfG family c-di-GMP phosphodiesterase